MFSLFLLLHLFGKREMVGAGKINRKHSSPSFLFFLPMELRKNFRSYSAWSVVKQEFKRKWGFLSISPYSDAEIMMESDSFYVIRSS